MDWRRRRTLPWSEPAAKAYQAGLNDLIARHSAMLVSTKVGHWFRTQVESEEDPLAWMIEPDKKESAEDIGTAGEASADYA